MSETILVGVDQHDQARDAVALGAGLAHATGDQLVVAHIYPYDLFADSIALGAPAAAPLQQEAKEIVMRAVEGQSAATLPLVAAHTSTVAGLHREAARVGAEILVVGSSHRGTIGRVAFGSHTTGALHGAPCAVAVAPVGLAQAGAAWRPATIAVAYDGSDESTQALALARRVARATGAAVRLVTVVEVPAPEWSGYSFNVRPDWATYEARAREDAERRVRAAAHAGEQIDVRTGVDTVAHLLAVGAEVSLLVMGSRGYGPVRRVMVGSTATSIVRDAPCPVIVVPRSAREDAPADAGPSVEATA